MSVGYRYTPKDDDWRILLFQRSRECSFWECSLLRGPLFRTFWEVKISWWRVSKCWEPIVVVGNFFEKPGNPLADMYNVLPENEIDIICRQRHTHTHIVFLIRLAEFFLHLSGCPHHVLHRHSHSSNRCSGLWPSVGWRVSAPCGGEGLWFWDHWISRWVAWLCHLITHLNTCCLQRVSRFWLQLHCF